MSQTESALPMDNDDDPVGRVWSRREVLGLLAAAGGSLTLAACAPAALQGPAEPVAAATIVPAATGAGEASGMASAPVTVDCMVSPEQSEGPFFVDDMLNRSDIRSDPGTGEVKPGAQLALAIGVAQVANGACTPLSGALVDIWHCDADGVYSAFNDGRVDARNEYFLRGQQVTDESGVARFTTIYPGWYPGRTVHIHVKVRSAAEGGNTWDFTSQLYFDDAFTDVVFQAAPYAERGPRNTRNAQDGIFARGGDQMIVPVVADSDGWRANFTIGMVM